MRLGIVVFSILLAITFPRTSQAQDSGSGNSGDSGSGSTSSDSASTNNTDGPANDGSTASVGDNGATVGSTDPSGFTTSAITTTRNPDGSTTTTYNSYNGATGETKTESYTSGNGRGSSRQVCRTSNVCQAGVVIFDFLASRQIASDQFPQVYNSACQPVSNPTSTRQIPFTVTDGDGNAVTINTIPAPPIKSYTYNMVPVTNCN